MQVKKLSKRAAGFVLMFSAIFAAANADQKRAVSGAMSKIVEAREQTEAYVVEVKQKYKPDQAVYQQARNLYVTAMAKHNAWIALVKSAIERGKTKNLDKDETYRSLAAQAENASQAFINYVQSKTQPSGERVLAAPLVAGLGLNIWNEVKDHKQKAREEEAARFERDARWRTWEAVPTGGT